MKQRAFIMLALLAGVLAGCGGTIPGVPQEFRDFFPYIEGDTIVFTNGLQEEKLCVTYNHVDEGWDYCGYADTKAFLPIEMGFQTDTASLFSLIGYMKSFNKPYFDLDLYFEIHECVGNVSFFFKTRIENPEENRRLVLESTKVFGQVEEEGMYLLRVVLERGKGITSFYDVQNDVEWVLKEIIK